MDRSAKNSVSFGKNLSYCRGSAYCIQKLRRMNVLNLTIIKKLKTIINYWRYCIHGDIKFSKPKICSKLPEIVGFIHCYIFFFYICLIDKASGRVVKTHIEFERNIKNKK